MVSGSIIRCSSARHTPRSQSFSSPRFSSAAVHRNKWFAPEPHLSTLAVAFFVSSLLLVLACAIYLYVFRNLGHVKLVSEFVGFTNQCDVFDGSWVRDSTYPLYNSSKCPFAERGFNCLANGRRDTDYLKWRWKPRGCDVPRFEVRYILERLRGKRIVFVGDSMSRTQWESLICMLMIGVQDPGTVYEVNGNKITKTIRFLGVQFQTFNLSVEFFRSVFLVQPSLRPRQAPKRVLSTLNLDTLDDISMRWVGSDVLIFNSGHWWTPTKLFDMGCYFQAGGSLKLGMPITSAFRMALNTWASWIETTIDTNRTHVFFRTFEPSHWSGSNKMVCEMIKESMPGVKGNDRNEFADIISEVVSKMRVPVTVLNVTSMGAYRSDAHIGNWSHPLSITDCSHWCLPGVPDAWNEILFSYLLVNDWRKFGR